MKKILITGGAGFIGANLARRLVADAGFEVYVIEKKSTNIWRLKDVIEKMNVIYVDLEDKKKLQKVIDTIKPNIVFHLAGYGAYPASQHDVMKMVDINIKGTLNLIDSLEKCPLDVFVNIGSSSEYKEKKTGINEEDIIDPANFYAITKLTSVLLLKKMAKEKHLPIINVRLFNVYGYYGNRKGFVHYTILNALRDKKIQLSSPHNVRDFIFIEDVVNLFLNIIKEHKNYQGEIFNVGSGNQYSIKEAVGMIEKLLDKKIQINYVKKGDYYREAKFFHANSTKAKKAFAWKPKYRFELGLKKTIDWFKENQELYNI